MPETISTYPSIHYMFGVPFSEIARSSGDHRQEHTPLLPLFNSGGKPPGHSWFRLPAWAR
jgi:hypothetical protein